MAQREKIKTPVLMTADALISPEEIFAAPITPEAQDFFIWMLGSGYLPLYVEAARVVHRLQGTEITPLDAIIYGDRVILENNAHREPVVSDFSGKSHLPHMRTLRKLLSPHIATEGINLQAVAGVVGAETHRSTFGLLGGKLPKKPNERNSGEDNSLWAEPLYDKYENGILANGEIAEGLLDDIVLTEIAVVEALSRGEQGVWEAYNHAERLYQMLRPILGIHVERIHRYTNPATLSILIPSYVNLATMVIWSQREEIQATCPPMLTEIAVLPQKFSGRADAVFFKGVDGKDLSSGDRQKINEHFAARQRPYRSIGHAILDIKKQLRIDVQAVIVDAKIEIGDNTRRDLPIDGEAITAAPLPSHAKQVIKYVTLGNLGAGMLSEKFPHEGWPQREYVRHGEIWYVHHDNIDGPTTHLINPSLAEQEAYFEHHIVQKMSKAQMHAARRGMLNVLVGDILAQFNKLQQKPSARSRRSNGWRQNNLFNTTIESIIEAHSGK